MGTVSITRRTHLCRRVVERQVSMRSRGPTMSKTRHPFKDRYPMPRLFHARRVNGESLVFHLRLWMQTRSISNNLLPTGDKVCTVLGLVPTKMTKYERVNRPTKWRARQLQHGKSRARWTHWRLMQLHHRRRRVVMRRLGRDHLGMGPRYTRKFRLLRRIPARRPRRSLPPGAKHHRARFPHPPSCLPTHHLPIEVGAERHRWWKRDTLAMYRARAFLDEFRRPCLPSLPPSRAAAVRVHRQDPARHPPSIVPRHLNIHARHPRFRRLLWQAPRRR